MSPISPQSPLAPKAAIVLHAFYRDVAEEILERIFALDTRHKIFVTTTKGHEIALRAKLEASGRDFTLRVFGNRGRDLLPFLRIFPEIRAEGFDYIVKLHTKKSLHRLDGVEWRNDILNKIVGDRLEPILQAFVNDPSLGMVGPEGHYLSVSAYMGSNTTHTLSIAERLGLTDEQIKDQGFFAGTMFVVRTAALYPLIALAFDDNHFEPEAGQQNGTLAHALERGMALGVTAAGMKITSGLGRALPLRKDYIFGSRLSLLQRFRRAKQRLFCKVNS